MNKAALVQSGEDIRYLMGWATRRSGSNQHQRKIFIELTPEEERIVELLNQRKELSIDEIMLESGFSMSKCSASLLNLEFENIVRCLPGKSYVLG
jgi:DNA processing protein